MDNLIGKRLDGRYSIESLVGVGGMANVYRGTDLKTGNQIAVKVLKDEFLDNEELVRRYYGGDERALEELYRRNLGLIRRIARETAREFNCLHMDRERPGELSGYTKTILEDLCGEGALEFLTRVQSREYDESRAVLATYLYPHLKGRMTRWLEQHIGNLSLSKHEMDAVRQAQRLYHSGQFSIEEIA